MPDSTPSSAVPPTLRTVAALSLIGGAVAGTAAFAALRLVVPEPVPSAAAASVATVPAAIAPGTGTTGAEPPAAEAFRAELDVAEAERSQLAGSLLALNRRAEALETRLAELANAAPPPTSPPAANADDPESFLPSGADGDILVAGADGTEEGEDEEETDSLVAAGLDPQSAADIRSRRDAFQLARLELVDQATREGWRRSDRFDDSLAELQETRPDLREELGDDAYDRYLFEEGNNNRVGIASVISGSAAAGGGLAAGDVVLSYAGERIFRPSDLQAATQGGNRGESVQLGVLRDGQVIAVDLERGPMGVTLNGVRRPPG